MKETLKKLLIVSLDTGQPFDTDTTISMFSAQCVKEPAQIVRGRSVRLNG